MLKFQTPLHLNLVNMSQRNLRKRTYRQLQALDNEDNESVDPSDSDIDDIIAIKLSRCHN